MLDQKKLFIYQFILGTKYASNLSNWNRLLFANNYYITYHPLLAVASKKIGNKEITFIGDVFDPIHTKRNNEEILDSLINTINCFDDFEHETSSFAGRFLILIRIDNEIRLYPDAFGSKSAFYYQNSNGDQWIASAPQIIAETLKLMLNKEVLKENQKTHYEFSYPFMQSPYDNINPLIPNHYLNLKSFCLIRYWPKNHLDEIDIDSAAVSITSLLSGIIESMLNRYEVCVTLTGGFDSRSVLAGCFDHLHKHKFITRNSPGLYRYDVVKPKNIAHTLDLNYQLLEYDDTDIESIDLMERNVAFMIAPEDLKSTKSVSLPVSSLLLVGCGSEIGRCWYYIKGIHPHNITSDYLRKIKQSCSDKYYDKYVPLLDDWLKNFPENKGVFILDLFFWELTMGSFAVKYSSTDIFHKSIPAMNCRAIAEKMLSVNTKSRAYPHLLHKRMVESRFPIIQSVKYNDCGDPAKVIRLLHKMQFNKTFLNKCLTRGFQELKYICGKVISF
jgi:hypothetical protein